MPAFIVIYFLNDNHSDWGEIESQRYFILYFFGRLRILNISIIRSLIIDTSSLFVTLTHMLCGI